MRIHTSADYFQIRATVAGLQGVYIETLTQHASKTHPQAFELHLSGNGRYGGQWGDRDMKSATWDEWGVVMARIFEIDPDTRMGGSAKPVYADAMDFHWQTNGRFGGWEVGGVFVAEPTLPEDTHPVHRWDRLGVSADGSYSVAQCKKCSALKRWALVKRHKAYA
jgi:hypothetical protein